MFECFDDGRFEVLDTFQDADVGVYCITICGTIHAKCKSDRKTKTFTPSTGVSIL